jgi:hypothetical protein
MLRNAEAKQEPCVWNAQQNWEGVPWVDQVLSQLGSFAHLGREAEESELTY